MSQKETHETFSLEKTYKASPERVFAAWASPEKKRRWFAEGEGSTVLSFESDFREGGFERSRFRMDDGLEMGNDTHYHDIVPNRRIVLSYAMTVGAKRISASLATITVEPAGSGTKLRFTEQAAFFEDSDGVEVRRGGWTELLDALGQSLAD
jgi:uncharacterized protein YndB with AHSA1/START domain